MFAPKWYFQPPALVTPAAFFVGRPRRRPYNQGMMRCACAIGGFAVVLFAADSKIDHVTIAGSDLKQMQAKLAAHRDRQRLRRRAQQPCDGNGAGQFPGRIVPGIDGHSAECGRRGGSRTCVGEIPEGECGPCAWAMREKNLAAEVSRLKAAGIAVSAPVASGRTRPDGVRLEWETSDVGGDTRGTFFPFLIQDRTPREQRAYPQGKPVTKEFRGVTRVVIAVRNLDDAIERYRQAYGVPRADQTGGPEFRRISRAVGRSAGGAGAAVERGVVADGADRALWGGAVRVRAGRGQSGALSGGIEDALVRRRNFLVRRARNWAGGWVSRRSGSLRRTPRLHAGWYTLRGRGQRPTSPKQMAKKILVNGAGGFIGGHLVKRLKAEGNWVRAVDLKQHEYTASPADEFIRGDLRDPARGAAGGGRHRRDLPAGGRHGRRRVYLHRRARCRGDAQFRHHQSQHAGIGVQAGVKRFFYSSSACMYPEYNQRDPRESRSARRSRPTRRRPDSEYGWEKLFSERLYFAYQRNYGIQVRVARFHNIFGPEGTWCGGREKAPAAICRKVAEAPDGGEIEIWGDGCRPARSCTSTSAWRRYAG